MPVGFLVIGCSLDDGGISVGFRDIYLWLQNLAYGRRVAVWVGGLEMEGVISGLKMPPPSLPVRLDA
jgi:hypothetical protein